MKKTSQKETILKNFFLIFLGFLIGITLFGLLITYNTTVQKENGLIKTSSCNSSIQNASIQGYLIRNHEQASEIYNYNMTYIFLNYPILNETYRLKLIPQGEWEIVR